MTPERKRIYNYIKDNPNSSVMQVAEALGLSKSQCYKFLRTDSFISTKVKNHLTQYMTYRLNNRQVIADSNVPRHHEIHQAFWGMR